LIESAPPGASWLEFVRRALARVDSGAAPGGTGGGPSDEQMAASAELSPDQRMTMIRGMVERLSERLNHDGSDVEGWLRLVRSYIVLGERDKARAAVVDARRALASEPDKLKRLDDLVQTTGPVDGTSR
jgi:cytochrome c-type biogenesis protein CcmH